MAGCNRFGIDNPCPIITKRLSFYGNTDDIEKDYKREAEKFRKNFNESNYDPDLLGLAELKSNQYVDDKGGKKIMDFNETILKSPLKKFSGITNF